MVCSEARRGIAVMDESETRWRWVPISSAVITWPHPKKSDLENTSGGAKEVYDCSGCGSGVKSLPVEEAADGHL